MLDAARKTEFLREGVGRYPDARETVDYFEELILEAMSAAFQTKADWKAFQPLRNGDRLEGGRTVGSTDRYIQSWIIGTVMNSPERRWLHLGLYWKVPRQPNMAVVAACHVAGEKGTAVPLVDLASRHERRVHLGALYRRTESRLFVDVGNDCDAAEVFPLLLDCADAALVTIPPEADRSQAI